MLIKTKCKTYVFYSDPGHGWLAVKKDELVKLNIINDVSGYSYMKGKTVYLEEDSDAQLFIKKMEELNKPFNYRECFRERTNIRNYPPFRK